MGFVAPILNGHWDGSVPLEARGSGELINCIPEIPVGSGKLTCPPPPPPVLMRSELPHRHLEVVAGPVVCFAEEDLPPALPLDPFFCIEQTNFRIQGAAHAIGNQLLEALREEGSATITKINQKKFSVKAKLCVQGLACDLKVRVYSQEGHYIVEFQRRSGDSMAFSHVYNLVAERLRSQADAHIGGRPNVCHAASEISATKAEPQFEMDHQYSANCGPDMVAEPFHNAIKTTMQSCACVVQSGQMLLKEAPAALEKVLVH